MFGYLHNYFLTQPGWYPQLCYTPCPEVKVSHRIPLKATYYEIVKYNLRTRKDIKVLSDRVRGLAEVNRKIDTLNAQLRTSKKDQDQDTIYFRRKIQT